MVRKSLPALSPAETEILRLVWESEPATVQEICDALDETRSITYATVQTLLRRLESKGYLRHESEGKAHRFFAAVKQEEVIKRTVGELLGNVVADQPIQGVIDPKGGYAATVDSLLRYN